MGIRDHLSYSQHYIILLTSTGILFYHKTIYLSINLSKQYQSTLFNSDEKHLYLLHQPEYLLTIFPCWHIHRDTPSNEII
jgi:hypothetical protein